MKDKKLLTIAIDGYSSCGKSTLAKALAKKLGYIFVDSGAMYRGVTLYALEHGLFQHGQLNINQLIEHLTHIQLSFKYNSTTQHSDLYLNNVNVERQIREPLVASHVSLVAAVKEVRTKLVSEQQYMGKNGGIIMDGRDIGTVVFPEAEVKFFVTAQPEIRAERRYNELQRNGNQTITLEEVQANLLERDKLDSSRDESPLIQSPDATLIDTSHLTPDEQLNLALKHIENHMSR